MLRHPLALLLPLVAVTVVTARDAAACGGCFVPPDANTQVTGHRMILSVSPTATTLWDQIEYSGDPESFAWVLPTKGVVQIGLSSDLLFNTLAFQTDPVIIQPYLDCPNSCGYDDEYGTGSAASGSGGGSAGGGVDVIAHEVVGPYETVQLSASDPAALQTWLDGHGYQIPADIAPVVDKYVSEGFNFLALKLIPGKGIEAMKPVRITTPGASATLPLRMVAAGTGAVTPITLWVVGEGRYSPSNFDEFTIAHDAVVWNWDANDSNYAALKKQGFDASGGMAWLIEAALPQSADNVRATIEQVVFNLPDQSGYGQPDGTGASDEAEADLDALLGGVDPNSMWLTRMHGELPRAALASDLFIGASMSQANVDNVFTVTKTTGKVPECPPDPCMGQSSGGWLFGSGGGGSNGVSGSGGACAFGPPTGPSALGALALAAIAALVRRRRAR